jgi:predicted nucleic-acid-binding protein
MARSSGSLDANVLLRLLLNDIADQHQAAVNLIQKATGRFTVADTAFIEVVFVLERNYQFTRVQIVEAIEGLASLAEITCNRMLLERALPVFKTHPSLSFEDCCLAIYASLNECEPLWTFDKKLTVQATSAKLIAG